MDEVSCQVAALCGVVTTEFWRASGNDIHTRNYVHKIDTVL